jgi:hypothetical protein
MNGRMTLAVDNEHRAEKLRRVTALTETHTIQIQMLVLLCL